MKNRGLKKKEWKIIPTKLQDNLKIAFCDFNWSDGPFILIDERLEVKEVRKLLKEGGFKNF